MSSALPGCPRVGPGVWGRTKRNLIAAISVCSLALMLRAAPALAQVQNLCLQEIDGVVTPDEYGNISTKELCSSDEANPPNTTGMNNAWATFIGTNVFSGTGTVGNIPNPSSLTGTGGSFVGIETVNDQFTQGTKLTDGVDAWVYKVAPGGPSKADLQQGVAGTYTYTQSPAAFTGGPATGDEILYYLVTRASNNGDELHGVWLFKSPVTFTNPSCTSNCTFTGNHSDGDLFILSGFTGGGGSVGIQVFEWSCSGSGAACDSSGSLNHVATGSCSSGASGLECGEVNDNTITVPGSLPNPSTGTSLATGLFFNGGVDLTSLFSGTTPCFSAIMFESIASPSCSTASLGTATCSSIGNAAAKFFIFSPGFTTCKIGVTKECGGGTANGTQTEITYPVGGIVSNADGGTVTLSSVLDDPTFDSTAACFASTASFNNTLCNSGNDACIACGQAAASGAAGAPTSESCTGVTLGATTPVCYYSTITRPTSGTGSCVGSSCTDTVTAKATGPGGSTIKPATQSASCSFSQLNAGLKITKNCQAGLVQGTSVVEVGVDTGYTVCNEQAALLSNVTVTDTATKGPDVTNITFLSGGVTCPSGITGPCLAPEGQTGDCAAFTGSYIVTSLSEVGGIGTDTCSAATPTQNLLGDTATASGQCSSSVCNTSSSCTLKSGVVTCTAMGGASCPLCPLQTLPSSITPPAE